MKRLMIVGAALAVLGHSALAQKTVTCTGTLIDVWFKPKGEWPFAVIYDAVGRYTCSIDRTGARHDPMRPCSVGEKCRIVGTYRLFGVGEQKTYAIQKIIDLSNFPDEQR